MKGTLLEKAREKWKMENEDKDFFDLFEEVPEKEEDFFSACDELTVKELEAKPTVFINKRRRGVGPKKQAAWDEEGRKVMLMPGTSIHGKVISDQTIESPTGRKIRKVLYADGHRSEWYDGVLI